MITIDKDTNRMREHKKTKNGHYVARECIGIVWSKWKLVGVLSVKDFILNSAV